MVEKVEMYQAVCDRCGKSYYDDFNGFAAWSDEATARNAAKKLEREVDAEIARVRGVEQARIDALQGDLFGEGGR